MSGDRYVGGLAGSAVGLEVESSFATGDVSSPSGGDRIGGLIGSAFYSVKLENVYATGNVHTTGDDVGGLVGYNDVGGTIINGSATGNVNGTNEVGGLIGSFENGEVNNSYASGIIYGASEVGGLVGSMNGGSIYYSFASATVNGSSKVGGLAGGGSEGIINNSYSRSNVTGTTHVGGLIGYFVSAVTPLNIDSSYAIGEVTGERNVGGLIGRVGSEFYEDYVHIDNSYATGVVSGTYAVGGLVGNRSMVTMANNLYYNVSGNAEECTATGNNTGCSAVTLQSYFFNVINIPMLTWDFDDVWDEVCDGEGYPVLAWQNASASNCVGASSDSSDSGSSGSSSSGGSSGSSRRSSSDSGPYVPKSYVASGNVNDGITREGLWRGDSFTFNYSSEKHSITINNFDLTVTGGFANVTVASLPQTFVLQIGESRDVDLTGDGRVDVTVKLLDIIRNRVSIFVKTLEDAPAPALEVEEETTPTQEEVMQEPQSSSKVWLIVLLFLLLIAAVGGIVFYKFRK